MFESLMSPTVFVAAQSASSIYLGTMMMSVVAAAVLVPFLTGRFFAGIARRPDATWIRTLVVAAIACLAIWLGDVIDRPAVTNVGFLVGIFVVPFMAGGALSADIRMGDYGWRFGLIGCTLVCAVGIIGRAWDPQEGWRIPLGVDLKGGVILVYEVEAERRETLQAILESDKTTPAELAQKSGLPERRIREVLDGSDVATVDERQKIAGAVGLTPAQIDWRDPSQRLEASDFKMGDLVQAITNRINPSGTQEIVVRPYGDRQVEIIIPDVGDIEVKRIKKLIGTAGALSFRIVANERDHQHIIDLATDQANSDDQFVRRSKSVVDPVSGEPIGYWARVARDEQQAGRPFKTEVGQDHLRNATTGELIDPALLGAAPAEEGRLAAFLDEVGVREVDVLMATNDGLNVTGEHLGAVSPSYDEYANPCVNFAMRGIGATLFGQLTSSNLPDRTTDFHRRLGIVLDEQLLSAPRILSRISDRGRITGQFTNEEIEDLVSVLRAGRLPATLKKQPISENQIGSMLGDDTIRKGKIAIGASLIGVLIFVLIYYRFAGVVACFALLANLVMILSLMVVLKAPLTLPGLAGLVLTVGMSVDANVLVFERIREELARGSALRMAIRNGFARATTTIVDANVTTLLTAAVLYAIGTDQIRGFAVTLIFGILMSMFTAIFCSRVFFDVAERARKLTRLSMMQVVGATNIDFLGMRMIAGTASVLVIAVGLVAVVARATSGTLLDIDFLGGSSVTVMLNEPMEPGEVRRRVGEELAKTENRDFSVNSVGVQGREPDTVYKIDSAVPEVEDLQQHLMRAFTEGQQSLLASYSMDFKVVPRPAPDRQSRRRSDLPPDNVLALAASAAALPPPGDSQQGGETGSPPPTAEKQTGAGDGQTGGAGQQTDAGTGGTGAAGGGQEPPPKQPDTSAPPANAPPAGQDTTPAIPPTTAPATSAVTAAEITFVYRINGSTLRDAILDAAQQVNRPIPDVIVDLFEDDPDFDPTWTMDSGASFARWNVRLPADTADVEQILGKVQQTLAATPIWESYSKIGGKVAGDTQTAALYAMLASLVGIIAYVWFRFQRVVFGLAAVIALVHDVLVTLGAIAVSAWLAAPLGFLLLEDFKISLPVVAAFLTIIGYSLNDTIVIFDRIREIRGKSPDLTAAMINTSINQTLSRTLLTSITTLIVVMILYTFGGQGIHGFAFALVVGVIAGTYSTVFIASPALLWMMKVSRKRQLQAAPAKTAAAR